MESVKVDFDWDNLSISENNSHNQNEWGLRKSDPIIITSYKMKWE
ncbi:hypothetical protein [Nitrosopumilus sp.]